MKLYRSRTGDIGNYVYWKEWATKFYTSLTYDDAGRNVSTVKNIDVLMPEDWWERTQKVLELELLGGPYND